MEAAQGFVGADHGLGREEPRPVADADVEATLPFVNPHVRGMVRLQRLTGARSGEVCAMRPADVDRSGPVWVYHPRFGSEGGRLSEPASSQSKRFDQVF